MANVAMLVNGGLGIINNRIKGTGTEPKHVAWGTDDTGLAVTNDDLEAEAAEARAEATTSVVTDDKTNDTYRIVGKITCTGAAKDIEEVGVFDDDTAGTLFVRGTHDTITVAVGDSIEYTINVKGDQA